METPRSESVLFSELTDKEIGNQEYLPFPEILRGLLFCSKPEEGLYYVPVVNEIL